MVLISKVFAMKAVCFSRKLKQKPLILQIYQYEPIKIQTINKKTTKRKINLLDNHLAFMSIYYTNKKENV